MHTFAILQTFCYYTDTITVWAEPSSNPKTRLRHPAKLTGIDYERQIYICQFLETTGKKNVIIIMLLFRHQMFIRYTTLTLVG